MQWNKEHYSEIIVVPYSVNKKGDYILTYRYLDPEYFLRRQLTTASDVYGYGVVLLELLTGQVAIDHRRTEDYNLVGWVIGLSLKTCFSYFLEWFKDV